MNGTALFPKSKGFTLVELLVVISIIAILSVIGVTVFSGVQKSARDAQRKGDVNSIANALEVNKPPTGTYPMLLYSFFASGKVPFDPVAGGYYVSPTGCGDSTLVDGQNACWYCLKGTATPGYCKLSTDSWIVSGTTEGSTWTVCANLETGNPKYYCKGSSQ